MSNKHDRDNRSNQLNPNNDAYWSSRDDESADDGLAMHSIYVPRPYYPRPAVEREVEFGIDMVTAKGSVHRYLLKCRTTQDSDAGAIQRADSFLAERVRELVSFGGRQQLAYASVRRIGKPPFLEEEYVPKFGLNQTSRMVTAGRWWQAAQEAHESLVDLIRSSNRILTKLAKQSAPLGCNKRRWTEVVLRWQERFYMARSTAYFRPTEFPLGQPSDSTPIFASDFRSVELDFAEIGQRSPLPSYSEARKHERTMAVLVRAANRRALRWVEQEVNDAGPNRDGYETFQSKRRFEFTRADTWWHVAAAAVEEVKRLARNEDTSGREVHSVK